MRAITTGKEKETLEYLCYVCVRTCSLEEIDEVDQYFEEIDTDAFVALIDFLGLHYCDGPDTLFYEGNANVCKDCLKRAIQILEISKPFK